MAKFVFLMLIIMSWATQAEDKKVLTVDRVISNNINLSFPNDNNIKPKVSDFKIVNYVLMSN